MEPVSVSNGKGTSAPEYIIPLPPTEEDELKDILKLVTPKDEPWFCLEAAPRITARFEGVNSSPTAIADPVDEAFVDFIRGVIRVRE